MKKTSKAAALLLSTAIAASLVGCGGSDDGATNQSTNSTKTESTVSAGNEEINESGEYQFPEGATLTIWATGISYDAQVGVTTRSDKLAWQIIEEKTGVHVEFIEPASGTESEAFSIMLNSGELPDIILGYQSYYSGGFEKAIEDEVILPLNEVIDKYMPNYKELRMMDEEIQRGTECDDGTLAAVYSINVPDQGPWLGYVVRQDWLEDLGLDIPETYDDWHEMLKQFKEDKGADGALLINSRGSDLFGLLSGGYGITGLGSGAGSGFYLDTDGKTIKYGPVEENYKDYLTMLSQWYAEGLIDQDYYTSTVYLGADGADIANGNVGCFTHTYNMVTSLAGIYGCEGSFISIPLPVQNEGDTNHFRQYNFEAGTQCATITTQCDNVELAARFLDYLCSDEGSEIGCYGEYGVTYEYDENGKPVCTDVIMNNEDGLSASQARDKYTCHTVGKYYWEREMDGIDDVCRNTIEHTWLDNNDGSAMLPAIAMTAEEGDAYAKVMSDCDTYAVEMTTKFITGQLDIEDNWDSYVSTLKDYGIEDAIALMQAAYNRYAHRPVQ